ncbi:MAG: protein O-GlcNAc transferase, partial [Humisphaera sp.]|nr:protein O-GlcNAc transferase [Humisphaera sp.]
SDHPSGADAASTDSMSDPEGHTLEAAAALHRAGRLDDAQAAYRSILQRQPNAPDPMHLLGVIALQQGRPRDAIGLISAAVALRPGVGTYHLNLASAMRAAGRVDDAIAEAERAIALDPATAPMGYHVAALAFLDGEQPADAAFCWERAIELDPGFAEAYVRLAETLPRIGRPADEIARAHHAAVAAARAMVARAHARADAHLLLGHALAAQGQAREAIESYRSAQRLEPDDLAVLLALATALRDAGQREQAIEVLAPAANTVASASDAHPNLINAQELFGRMLGESGRLLESAAVLRAALAHAPDRASLRAALATAHLALGEGDTAIADLREAVRLDPDHAATHSTLLYALHYSSAPTPQAVFDEHVAWARRFAEPLTVAAAGRGHANIRDPDRPLRIGILSSDLRDHTVGRMLEPILAAHDRAAFPIICYATLAADAQSERLRARASGWRDVSGRSDEEIAELIRQDAIDVLIDVGGHTAHNRLLVFARKPAPVQVSLFGYPGTTGMSAIDYRITDTWLDPPGEAGGGADALFTEELVRLPRPSWCYPPPSQDPPAEPIPVADLPMSRDEPLTFGCVNSLVKISAATAAVWRRILSESPDSRLLLVSSSAQTDYLSTLAQHHGLPLERLVVVPRIAGRAYWRLYDRIDVVLDPFPHTGGLTTCDSLWMGVPVVTLAGQTHVARQGVMLLNNVGLPDLVAQNVDEYSQIARDLGRDAARLKRLRHELRGRMTASPLCDGVTLAAELQRFFRDAWRRYCAPVK